MRLFTISNEKLFGDVVNRKSFTGNITNEKHIIGSIETAGNIVGAINPSEFVVGTLASDYTITGQLATNMTTSSDFPYYEGETTVTPDVYDTQVLETANTVVTRDIRVLKIPTYETSNEYGV